MVGIEQVDEIDAKVPLEPDDVALGTVQDLDDPGVGEKLAQRWQQRAQSRRKDVDDKVGRTGRQLEQTGDAVIGTEIVVLEINGDLGGFGARGSAGAEMGEQTRKELGRVDESVGPRSKRVLDRRKGGRVW